MKDIDEPEMAARTDERCLFVDHNRVVPGVSEANSSDLRVQFWWVDSDSEPLNLFLHAFIEICINIIWKSVLVFDFFLIISDRNRVIISFC